ncbi:class I SAM-dependent methyltransferase [Actinacidiphila glaucinigra]|uniref:class I SAM-dependent methyltransferase n=1 Tax=Actinacidiphila glaucinigra TaxID=235986 RepID=UPI0033A65368
MASLGRLYSMFDDVVLPEDIPYAQMSDWEQKFLYLVARHHVNGTGALVELGSGGGGSTYAIAKGLRENPAFDEKKGRLHAYDFFRVGKGTFATQRFFKAGKAPEGGNSFREDFEAALAPFMGFVEVHAGDIWNTSDPQDKSPIEFLHIDIAKTARVFRCVAERFLPRLEPGAVVLHQDFASPRLPWLHHSTGALLPYIEIAGAPIRSTLVFEVVRPIPAELLERIAKDEYTVDERLALITAVQDEVDLDHTGRVPFKQVLELAKAYVCHYEGDHRRAWRIAEPLLKDPYLSETRADHFAQLRRALGEDAAPAPAPSRVRRLLRRVTGR